VKLSSSSGSISSRFKYRENRTGGGTEFALSCSITANGKIDFSLKALCQIFYKKSNIHARSCRFLNSETRSSVITRNT
jgi:hypothetical protein